MSDAYSLTLKEIAHRLHIGESTLNVWRKRYGKWMPETLSDDPERVLDVFRLIARCTNAGFDTDEIRRILQSTYEDNAENHDRQPDLSGGNGRAARDNGLKDTLDSLKDLMTGIVSQQARIAEAQERRAAAQERMAYAMESRAENEMLRTSVMRDLVVAIQDLSVRGSVNSMIEHVKSMPGPSVEELADFSQDIGFDMDDLEELTVSDSDKSAETPFPDFDETAGVDHGHEEPMEEPAPPMADEDFPPKPAEPAPDPDIPPEDMDDLSLLLEESDGTPLDMDDLSLLLEPEDRDVLSAPLDMDDLSLLLEESDKAPQDMDDLSLLIDEEPAAAPVPPAPTPEKPAATSKASAEDDYKSTILKKIIQMKRKENLSVEQTTQRLNDEGFRTLSGKGQWDVRTIQGIYKYIDSFS